MGSKSRFNGCLLLVLIHLFAIAGSARATVTVLNYWRMGENDPGAVPLGKPVTAIDSVGTNNLTYSGSAIYSTNVAAVASTNAYSRLSVELTNSAYASSPIVSTNVDNFGIEAWVNPASVVSGQIIVYNGNTATTGWGILVSGSTYSAIFGGHTIFGTDTAVAGTWTHVALVRNNGTATLYVNGVASGTSPATPTVPLGNFAFGAPPTAPSSQFYTGLLDEVRIFTFAPGQFSTNDLLFYQNSPFTLSSTNVVESPAAGSDFVRLMATPPSAYWTAATANTWLHLAATNGINSSNYLVSFAIDANTNGPRTGTLAVAGQIVNVTQAGSNYVAAATATLIGAGLNGPSGLVVDGAGNVYIADTFNNVIKRWNVASQTITNLVATGLNNPFGVAVDHAGNVYIADTGNNVVKEWNVTNHTVTTVVATGLDGPYGVTVDGAGNVYIADTFNNAVKEWNAASRTVTNLVTTGLNDPAGVAVDGSGNVYIADFGNNAVEVWNPASQTLNGLIGGLNGPYGVAVDAAGNVYAADTGNDVVKEWNAASQVVTVVGASGLSSPTGAAVDGAGGVYIADYDNNAIKELPRAFLVNTQRFENGPAGYDSLLPVVPATANLAGVFYPLSDQSWLTVPGITNGTVTYAFTSNLSGTNRTAHITLLGVPVSVTQSPFVPPPPFILGYTNWGEGASAGTDIVSLAASASTNAWTAVANAAWLHLTAGSQAGSGNAAITFTFDADSGVPRTGTLTVAGQTITIAQAGSNYVSAATINVVSSGLSQIRGMALDGAGNVYIADLLNQSVKEWIAASQTVTNLIPSGLLYPEHVAADGAGNLYISDGSDTVKEWNVTNQTLTTLIPGLSGAPDLAIDRKGNIYLAIDNAIKIWSPTNPTPTVLVSGLNGPTAVAVDNAGNLYIADTGNGIVREWNASNHQLTTLISSVVPGYFYSLSPYGVAVDGAGNVFVSDQGNRVIEKWTAATHAVTVLIGQLPNSLYSMDLAVDASGDLFSAASSAYANSGIIFELPRAYVNNAPRTEPTSAGNDALPPVVPATASLAGTYCLNSDQLWLTITGVSNGVVSFSFTASTAIDNRVGHITVLGVPVTITQPAIVTAPVLTGAGRSGNGGFHFGFINNPNASFTVLASTNLALPLTNWTVVGVATNLGSGNFQFGTPLPTNSPQMFYRVRSP